MMRGSVSLPLQNKSFRTLFSAQAISDLGS